MVRHTEQPDPAGAGGGRRQPGVPLGGRPRRPRSTGSRAATLGGESYDINLGQRGTWSSSSTTTTRFPADVMSAAEATIAALAVASWRPVCRRRRRRRRRPRARRRQQAPTRRRPRLGGAGRHRRPGDDGGLTSSWRRLRGPCCCRCAASRRGSPASSPTTTSTSTCAPGRSTPCSARTAPARAR